MSQNISDHRGGYELSNLILNRGNSLSFQLITHPIKLSSPEGINHRIANTLKNLISIFFLRHKPKHIGEGCFWYLKKCENNISQDIFQARSPAVAIEFKENSNNT